MSKKVNKKDLGKLLGHWSQKFAVFVPSKENDVAMMVKWDGEDIAFLGWYRNTVIPPKANFLPNLEEMFSFQMDGASRQVEMPPTPEKQLLFGIRPCDARALSILDMTFTDGYEDPYYLGRRQNAVLVGLSCSRPYDSCFCTSLGISPAESKDVDLMFVDTGDEFLIEEVTDKGKELIAATSGLEEAAEADMTRVTEAREKVFGLIKRKLDTNGVTEKLNASFEDKAFWEKVAAKCISCGICTFLCPTCYCFDINDEVNGQEGTRYRNWDCCSFCLYTKMPMENPRHEKWRRVRQKVCHKYEFYPMNFDVIACTGCGRCIRLCPVNWDITQTLESIPSEVVSKK